MATAIAAIVSCTSGNTSSAPVQADASAVQADASAGADAAAACAIPLSEIRTVRLGAATSELYCTPGDCRFCDGDEVACGGYTGFQLDPATGCLLPAHFCYWDDGSLGFFNDCFKSLDNGWIIFTDERVARNRPGWMKCDPTDKQKVDEAIARQEPGSDAGCPSTDSK